MNSNTEMITLIFLGLLCLQVWGQTPSYCSLKPEVGFCDAVVPRYYYDTRSNQCQQFTWGGCGGNENNFETVAECQKTCYPTQDDSYCLLQPDVGICKAAIPRYYYDSSSNQCLKFTYGGCGGNQNNFQTEEECKKACYPRRG